MEHLFGPGPIVGDGTYTWYPAGAYQVIDFVAGLLLGAWVPLMQRARNYDCYAAFWGVAISWFGQHKIFDDEVAPEGFIEWGLWLIAPSFAIIQMFTTNLSCNTQSEFAGKVPWLTKYYQGDKMGTYHSADHSHP
jgi:hypothetical protein